jgi:C_GCAxxG_C_C family probable redox protein
MNLEDQAVAEYGGASNCAQSILVTYLPALGFRKETASALGSGLGGGVGGRQEICGALNGGAIVLSYAKKMEGDPDPGARCVRFVARAMDAAILASESSRSV